MTEMADFERALAAGLASVAGTPKPGALERLVERVERTPQRHGLAARIGAHRSDGSWSLATVLAPAVVVVILATILIGTSVLLVTRPAPPEPAPSLAPAPATERPSASVEPTTSASETFLDWQLADVPGPNADAIGGSVHGVAAFSEGLVAVGTELVGEAAGGGQRAAVWMSTDGSAWTAVPNQPSFEDGVMLKVAVAEDAIVGAEASGDAILGELIVAVGHRLPDGSTPSEEAPAVWYSIDGQAWTRVDDLRLCLCDEDAEEPPTFTTLTAAQVGVFWAGVVDADTGQAELWQTQSGTDWGQSTQPEQTVDLWPGAISRVRWLSTPAHDPQREGILFLAGSRTEEDGSNRPAIWVNNWAEGTSLHRASLDSAPDGTRLVDVARGTSAFVAVANAGCCEFTTFTSVDDGETWVAHPGPVGEESTSASAVVGNDDIGVVAFGTVGATEDVPGAFSAWTSDTGESWAVIPEETWGGLGGTFQFSDAIVRPDGSLLVVGSASDADEGSTPVIWVVR